VPAASDIGRVSLTITIGDGNGDHPQGPVCQVVGALIEGIVTGAGAGALTVEEEKGSVVSPDGLVLEASLRGLQVWYTLTHGQAALA
jgi:hypothetical protein